jgi:hypothetical protein
MCKLLQRVFSPLQNAGYQANCQVPENEGRRLVNNYLRVDEDGDYVMRTATLSFLGGGQSLQYLRRASIRLCPFSLIPDEDFLLKRQHLALKNSTFCPITYMLLKD